MRQVVSDASGNDAASQQSIAREPLVEPEQPLTDAEAMRMRHGVARVIGNHAEVADVVVQALHLEEHHAKIPGAIRDDSAGRALQRLTERQGMSDGRIPGNPLGQLDAVRRRPALEQLFGALVREIQARLHIDDGLAHDAEAEMARLDDARMHGADRNLVDAFAADFAERKRPAIVVNSRGAASRRSGK